MSHPAKKTWLQWWCCSNCNRSYPVESETPPSKWNNAKVNYGTCPKCERFRREQADQPGLFDKLKGGNDGP